MSSSKLVIQGAAGALGGEALNVEEVFSTYLYEGNGSTQTITNGIDLDGEGGLVWLARRTIPNFSQSHYIVDTERGGNKFLQTYENAAQSNDNSLITSFNSNGFTMGNTIANTSGDDVSWTFRKAPKFFDVVTYTGTGSARTVSHNLGSAPGCIIVKRTDGLKDWAVYHRGKGSTHYGTLNTTETFYDNATWWNDTDPTSTEFTVGTSAFTNNNGHTYVAYLFAHNDGDGEFGPDGDADIIKCGSYTGTGSSQEIDLGFEAQWVLIKNTTNSQSWAIIDNMRGFTVEGVDDEILTPNDSTAEGADNRVFPTASGFGVHTADYRYNGSGSNYIYIAIRRGPMAVPEDADDVFEVTTQGAVDNVDPGFKTSWPVDFAFRKDTDGSNSLTGSRLTGIGKMYLDDTGSEVTNDTDMVWDFNNGWWGNSTTDATKYAWMWRRAPNFFDVVAYTGTAANRTVDHNLGVAPEMMWVKNRADAVDWWVYHKDTGATKRLYLNQNYAALANSTAWNNTAPTDSVFTVGTSSQTNGSGDGMIAYLFASLDGVSKVGSFTTSGSDVDVDCGFSAGPRFVLIKNTASGHWFVMDSERGITSGNDPFLTLNTSNAESSSLDLIDINPTSSGFTVNQGSFGDGTFIFYAIA